MITSCWTQDLLHYMVSVHARVGRQATIEEAAGQLQRLANKHAWWWDTHRRNATPTTLYWRDDP
jgi:hypothetical protein